MFAMALDGFLELLKGKDAVEGETLDKTFGTKSRKAMSITSFKLSPQGLPSKKKKKGHDATEHEEEHDDEHTQPTQPKGKHQKPKYPLAFTVSKEIDSASTELFLAYCRHADDALPDNAKCFDLARVTLRKAESVKPV